MANCRKVEQVAGCFTDGSGVQQPVIIHSVCDVDGVVIATYYLDAAGAIIDTSGGSVAPGACSLSPSQKVSVSTVGNGVGTVTVGAGTLGVTATLVWTGGSSPVPGVYGGYGPGGGGVVIKVPLGFTQSVEADGSGYIANGFDLEAYDPDAVWVVTERV